MILLSSSSRLHVAVCTALPAIATITQIMGVFVLLVPILWQRRIVVNLFYIQIIDPCACLVLRLRCSSRLCNSMLSFRRLCSRGKWWSNRIVCADKSTLDLLYLSWVSCLWSSQVGIGLCFLSWREPFSSEQICLRVQVLTELLRILRLSIWVFVT